MERVHTVGRSLVLGFAELSPEDQDAQIAAQEEFAALVYEHTCEGFYAAPEYGGNRGLAGWRVADWSGDVVPRGWTAEEVLGTLLAAWDEREAAAS